MPVWRDAALALCSKSSRTAIGIDSAKFLELLGGRFRAVLVEGDGAFGGLLYASDLFLSHRVSWFMKIGY